MPGILVPIKLKDLMAADLFPVIFERVCGLDVHKATIVATIKGVDVVEQTQTFGTFPEDIHSFVGWFQNHGVTHVAMESTGLYWKPVY